VRPHRVAAYWAPQPEEALHRAGSSWLGRDAATGTPVPQPPLEGIAAVTPDAARYGFHATLKPPMRLISGATFADVLAAARAAAQRVAPFDLPPLHVADLHGFLALRETEPCPPLHALADACVAGLDACRAPPEPEELARRRRAQLRPAQAAMLARWGYPYVFGTWYFHMTLTCRLESLPRAHWHAAAAAHFAEALAEPVRVRAIALFVQAEPDGDFVIAERIPLG
jgi:putative phosphonate metabolism protein